MRQRDAEGQKNAATCGRGDPRRPDIVFFMVDQLSARWLEAARGGVVPTPNFDRLAERGVTLSRCISSNPVCQPARATLATGLTSRQHGVLQNGYFLDRGLWNFMRALQQGGWRTGSLGKIHFFPHFQHIRPPYEGWGWDVVVHTEDLRAGDWLDWIEQEHPEWYDTALALTRAPWIPEFAAYGPRKRNIQKRINEILKAYRWATADFPKNTDFAYTLPFPSELSQTEWITRHAERFIAETPADKPLYAHISYVQPHSPYCPPAEYMHKVDTKRIPTPAPAEWYGNPKAPRYFQGRTPQPGDWMLYRHYYFADIAHLDAQLGRVMDALEKAGRWDNTCLVFLSDHGELLGDHGFHQKEERHYDACIRVPLMIAGPGLKRGLVRDDFVQLEDIAPTVLDMAGLPQPRYENRMSPYMKNVNLGEAPMLPGRSLLPLCRGKAPSDWRDAAYVESYNAIWSVDPMDWARTIRTGQWRYTFWPTGGGEQLFDLEADPQEQKNLADNRRYAALKRRLRDRLMEMVVLQDHPLTNRELFGIGLH